MKSMRKVGYAGSKRSNWARSRSLSSQGFPSLSLSISIIRIIIQDEKRSSAKGLKTLRLYYNVNRNKKFLNMCTLPPGVVPLWPTPTSEVVILPTPGTDPWIADHKYMDKDNNKQFSTFKPAGILERSRRPFVFFSSVTI